MFVAYRNVISRYNAVTVSIHINSVINCAVMLLVCLVSCTLLFAREITVDTFSVYCDSFATFEKSFQHRKAILVSKWCVCLSEQLPNDNVIVDCNFFGIFCN